MRTAIWQKCGIAVVIAKKARCVFVKAANQWQHRFTADMNKPVFNLEGGELAEMLVCSRQDGDGRTKSRRSEAGGMA